MIFYFTEINAWTALYWLEKILFMQELGTWSMPPSLENLHIYLLPLDFFLLFFFFFFVPVIPENGDQVLGRLFPQLPWGHISAGFPLPHFRSKLRRSQVVNTGDCQVDLSPITSYDHGIIIIESLLGQRKSSYWTILLQVAM